MFDAGALKLTVGDVVMVTDLSDHHTWSGYLNGVTGTFPSDCVELGANENEDAAVTDLDPSVRIGVGVSQSRVKTLQDVRQEASHPSYNPFLGATGAADSSEEDDADVDAMAALLFSGAAVSGATAQPAAEREHPLLRTTGAVYKVKYLGSLAARDTADADRFPRFFHKLRGTPESSHAKIELHISGPGKPSPCPVLPCLALNR